MIKVRDELGISYFDIKEFMYWYGLFKTIRVIINMGLEVPVGYEEYAKLDLLFKQL